MLKIWGIFTLKPIFLGSLGKSEESASLGLPGNSLWEWSSPLFRWGMYSPLPIVPTQTTEFIYLTPFSISVCESCQLKRAKICYSSPCRESPQIFPSIAIDMLSVILPLPFVQLAKLVSRSSLWILIKSGAWNWEHAAVGKGCRSRESSGVGKTENRKWED